MKNKLPASGFTLIELMVVMTVISILATMTLYGLGKAQASARDASRQQIMTGIQTALERMYGDRQCYYNGSGSGLCTGVEVPGNFNFCPLVYGLKSLGYLSEIPVDPKSKQPVCPNWIQWHGTDGTTERYFYAGPDGSNCKGSSPQAYQLKLVKESGGTNYFCSPN